MAAGPKPKGPDEVRRALLDAATRQFVAKGLRASLRDIANDAGVNLGLIHHHFGNKDDLLRAVFADLSRLGTQLLDTGDLRAALQQMFELSMSQPNHARLAAWLMLDDDGGVFAGGNELIDVLRRGVDEPAAQRDLMAALTLVYGWTVFGDFMIEAFEADAERAQVHEHIAERISALAERAGAERRPPDITRV